MPDSSSIHSEMARDIERYLGSKIPELPEATRMEIGEYISNRVNRYAMEAFNEYERIMEKRVKRYTEKGVGRPPRTQED